MINKRPPQNVKIYDPKTYESFNLWLDYWQQFELINEVQPQSVLEVGKGTGTLGFLLKRQGYKYTCADTEKSLKPDLVCDITKIPVKDKSFDVVCAFQVLEHIPYQDFEVALKEMKRIARKTVIISLPYSTLYVSFGFSFFYAKSIDWLFRLLNMKPHTPKHFSIKIPTFFLNKFGMTPTHAWEMGRKGYSKKKIENSIKNSGLSIVKQKERLFYPYHRYYILKLI